MISMKERRTAHDTFVIDRTFAFDREVVFASFASAAAKSQWFAGPAGWQMLVREMDFRPGGDEKVAGRFPDGRVSSFAAHYYDIVPNERIVYTYEMHLNDLKISVSLATIEFKEHQDGTQLVITEQGVFLDDFDGARGREEGTGILMNQLAEALRRSGKSR
jgi:uncharacterized protein YndB with AHSA1/START domain